MMFIIHVLANAIGLLAAKYFVPGIHVEGDIKTLLLFGAILGAINYVSKPVLKFVFGPLILLTFGVFGLIINVFLLWLAATFVGGISITGISTLAVTALIISALNTVIVYMFKNKK